MGHQSCKVRCTASPGPDNDRPEQKILDQWNLEDGVRYFSLAFYVPDGTPTPYIPQLHTARLSRFWDRPTNYVHATSAIRRERASSPTSP